MRTARQKQAGADRFQSAPENAHLPPKDSVWLCRPWFDFPPEFDRPLAQLRGIENMSERFSVRRGSLSPFVGNTLPLIFRDLKQFGVSRTAI
jgi:hypothetical protein